MTGFSKLLSTSPALVNSSALILRNSAGLLKNSTQLLNNHLLTQVRGSHGRTMFIRPGKFFTKKYFDILHFHVVLTSLPFLLILGYQNFFVGPARLAEIPEGYEPRHWEYHRNPIQRFLAKYVYEAPEKSYEIALHELYVENCRQKMRLLERKVKAMMAERQDYKAWFYIPVPKETFDMKKQNIQEHNIGYETKYTK